MAEGVSDVFVVVVALLLVVILGAVMFTDAFDGKGSAERRNFKDVVAQLKRAVRTPSHR
ncbi:hypothetical protein [Saccharopolyspora oryzae]|uniref:Uncharacterized protein n=1 Tax=Saccharopolyspora oryzae TaxID=2997343 RepID=A0ABT4V5S5_9PSEU|nr:hypothetical protein [Saccharopolyspora oryzae]MDA3628786.1 hypothetical protein [Saccharopolyspora oryzae]